MAARRPGGRDRPPFADAGVPLAAGAGAGATRRRGARCAPSETARRTRPAPAPPRIAPARPHPPPAPGSAPARTGAPRRANTAPSSRNGRSGAVVSSSRPDRAAASIRSGIDQSPISGLNSGRSIAVRGRRRSVASSGLPSVRSSNPSIHSAWARIRVPPPIAASWTASSTWPRVADSSPRSEVKQGGDGQVPTRARAVSEVAREPDSLLRGGSREVEAPESDQRVRLRPERQREHAEESALSRNGDRTTRVRKAISRSCPR